MLRRICGPKRDELTGDWRKLHNKKLHFIAFTKKDEMGQVARRRKIKMFLKRSLGSPKG
jgi:hypothetical protein